MTVKEMIEENNEKRVQLTSENEEYYSNLLVYIRLNTAKSERACEEVLLEMLDHLIEAQQDGKSAEEVFGKSPQALGDEIIQSLPTEPKAKQFEFIFEILLTFFGWAMIPWGIVSLIKGENVTVYLGKVGVSASLLIIVLALIMYIVFGAVKKSTYKPLKKKRYWLSSGLAAIIWLGGLLFVTQVKGFGPTIQMSYYTIFGLGCFFLLAAHLLKKSRESQ